MRTRPTRWKTGLLLALLLALLPAGAALAEGGPPMKRRLCVFDPAGKAGDYYRIAADYRAAAAAWGLDLELLIRTEETLATQELSSGRCDAALMTGSRARRFNRFSGSVEAIGGLPNYEDLGELVKLLASPKAGEKLVDGKFQTVAIFPAGHLYLLFRDREHATLATIAGKRIATLTYDDVSRKMVELIGASTVPAEVSTFSGIFNNGSADACYSPVTAIAPLELLRGVGKKGGILRVSLAQITLQIVARTDVEWPADFPLSSRKYAAGAFEKTLRYPRKSEADLPAAAFIDATPETIAGYEDIFQRSRIALRESGVYDPTMLRLLRRIRCKRDPRRAECAQKLE
ncbi:MAG: DUF6091 family protein [Deltaproteobacteria bacterium]|nr:DUF6091 family protein [Deltaproteobacteria bacterium]